MDNVGLQTVCNIEEHYIQECGNIPRYPVDFIRKEYIEKGNTGTNTGEGLYDHTAKKASDREQEESPIANHWSLGIYSMGRDCQGIIMYTLDGYMSAQLQTPGQPHFAQNDLSGGTEEELAEAGKNYLAYTGPFYIDESGEAPILRHHMTDGSFSNWLGNTQRRMVKILEENGDKRLILAPNSSIDIGHDDNVSTTSVSPASSDVGTEGEGDGEEDTQSLHDLLMQFDEVEQRAVQQEVEQPVVQQEDLEEVGDDQAKSRNTESDEESEEQ
ncbi:hypothetical protein LTS18_008266 [Coniosporium uncinatum]|uniref:Uncharacterized protein n=1 Tax=Coniosporium uncinatum TaxID=93489 RepID=A0ACC3DNJ1_9PEZI|nr:hypothetical protein LTS18_008266 [Coniosporium uncinatum]